MLGIQLEECISERTQNTLYVAVARLVPSLGLSNIHFTILSCFVGLLHRTECLTAVVGLFALRSRDAAIFFVSDDITFFTSDNIH